ncbi:MAG TPA: penicillin-insensitive murein endopeptidase [Kofleriaceae bacterium]|nr:penicillin-insensitive murein endopeptidase [Kofleriaceae bacterium]
MARWRTEVSLLVLAAALLASAAVARAGVGTRRSHRVASGDSLWTIARTYQCTVEDLRRANRLDGDTIQPGQRLRIPACKADHDDKEQARPARRKATRTAHAEEARERPRDQVRSEPPVDEVRSESGDEPLDVVRGEPPGPIDEDHDEPLDRIDADTDPYADAHVDAHVHAGGDADIGGEGDTGGAAELDEIEVDALATAGERARARGRDLPPRHERFIETRPATRTAPSVPTPRPDDDLVPVAVPIVGQSIGRPQTGYLVSGKHMPANPKLYYLRRPERAWGTSYTVDHLVRAIKQVHRRFPRLPALAIGDISARHGGRISLHGSHRSGRDADIGFYFRKPPRGYPRAFAVATADNLDFNATWALISTLCKTAADQSAGGVERIYMTYGTQAIFYRLARQHHVPREQLEWFQYPHGRRADHGIIRHEPGHEEHFHVRFHCAANDPECE